MNEKLWGITGPNGNLVEAITGEVELTTRLEAEIDAANMTATLGKTFTPVYLK